MQIKKFSKKQGQIFRFIEQPESTLICDGAVRSGKTVSMILAYVIWAMSHFDRTNFAICGKTVRSAERNIMMPLQSIEGLPYCLEYKVSKSILTVRCGRIKNYFYLFGGKDESSYMLIQGLTLAGVLFDEVALMPQNFVDQAIARTLTFPNKKLWFNCNPESPQHWFNQEWVLKAEERGVRHLHFLMEDNPAMTPEGIAEAEKEFSGVFYDRYIRGLWVLAKGRIYDMFDRTKHVAVPPGPCTQYYISLDYGTQNPTAMLLWGKCGGVWYLLREYYYNGRESKAQKTDEQYYDALVKLAGNLPIRAVIVDPSAASMIACIRQHGRFMVRPAENAVLDGIRVTATALSSGKIKICECCENTLQEIQGYVWDDKAARHGEDKPLKVNDHAMDAMRYFCMEVLGRPNPGPITIGG